jgi:multicomponent Na+:H+ antiporter subunit C
VIFYVEVLLLLAVGVYGLLAKKNVLKKILGLCLVDNALNLLFVAAGYRRGGVAPILLPGQDPAEFAARSVDPIPQALVLTSIVISLGMTMLLVALALRIQQRCGTLDVDRLDRLKG